MLIRSQDKSRLISLNNTRELRFWECAQGFNITDCVCPIGHYSTREKAMKVLDMIQEAYEEYKITCTFLTGFTGHRAIVESNDIHVNGLKELVKKFKKNMVFQMPEDSEVEV
jgi:hypothetical protein|nr:MAG TPA: hypothetical protein [Caudoviricetes sp.]